MGKAVGTSGHQTVKKARQRIVALRPKERGNNTGTNKERPFSILSEEEKNKVLEYCVEQAYRFYTSKNSQF